MHEALEAAVERYIAKANDDLEEALEKAGYADAKGTVKRINALEDNVCDTLGKETQKLIDWLNEAEDNGVELSDFIKDKLPELTDSDDLTKDLKKLFVAEFSDNMLDVVDLYIKTYDPELIAEEISQKTKDWIDSWGGQLASLMKLNNNKAINNILSDALENGDGCGLAAANIDETGLREGYRARTVAVTEMLRAHSVAQNEAINQNPSIEEKEWVHTGSGKNNPRQNHVDMDGQIVPKDGKFTLNGADGGVYECDFPRDPVLPVGEVANCHCLMRGIVSSKVLGLPLAERQRLQSQAIADMDDSWETEQNANNKAKAGIEV